MRKLRASWRDCYMAAILIGFVGYCLGPSLIGLRTLLSVDLLSNFYPWIAAHSGDLSRSWHMQWRHRGRR